MEQSGDDERDDDRDQDDRHRGLRPAREFRAAVVQGDEQTRRHNREQLCQRALVEPDERQGGDVQERLQGDDDPEAESVDVERGDDAVAEPRHPAAEESPRVAHGSADPEVPATRFRERRAEFHVGHRGEHRDDEIQAEGKDQGGPRDREAGPDQQEDRRPDRRTEADHRDVQEAEVATEFDLDFPGLCHPVRADRGFLISPWSRRRGISNTSIHRARPEILALSRRAREAATELAVELDGLAAG